MQIAEACKTIRYCNDAFSARQPLNVTEADVALAVSSLKAYLERARADGKPIRELELADHLLCTPEAFRWLMPFVLSAEGMIAFERRSRKI